MSHEIRQPGATKSIAVRGVPVVGVKVARIVLVPIVCAVTTPPLVIVATV